VGVWHVHHCASRRLDRILGAARPTWQLHVPASDPEPCPMEDRLASRLSLAVLPTTQSDTAVPPKADFETPRLRTAENGREIVSTR
jgi:hypothetical protein